MNKIKVIKKESAIKPKEQIKPVDERKSSKSKGRDAIKTVETWITEWRNRNRHAPRLR